MATQMTKIFPALFRVSQRFGRRVRGLRDLSVCRRIGKDSPDVTV